MDSSSDSGNLGFYETARYRLALSVAIGTFFALFLVIFQPFGVNNYNPKHTITVELLLAMGGVGAGVTLASLINEFGLRPLVFKRASVRRVVGWSLWTCVLLSQVAFLVYKKDSRDTHLEEVVAG